MQGLKVRIARTGAICYASRIGFEMTRTPRTRDQRFRNLSGGDGSNRETLRKLAEVFTSGPVEAEAMVSAYEQQVRTHFDPLLEV
jgi:hypothetical protein